MIELLSNLLYLGWKVTHAKSLLRRAASVDPQNWRAALTLSRLGEGRALESLTFRLLQEWRWKALLSQELGNPVSFDSAPYSHFADFSDSQSQLLQDLFVLETCRRKRGGFFVEVGVGDGVHLSNTHLLESRFGWSGILAEPNPRFHESIASSRRAILDKRAVYCVTGEQLPFLCVTDAPELSVLNGYAADGYQRSGQQIDVGTVSLADLLREHGAPRVIDYISIDTEGSELEVLRGMDFDRYDVRILTVEHNNVPARRDAILGLLASKGYADVSVLPTFDAWFVRTVSRREDAS